MTVIRITAVVGSVSQVATVQTAQSFRVTVQSTVSQKAVVTTTD